ncbi:11269_t:CDS:2, partial [Ambispora leptoticha]
ITVWNTGAEGSSTNGMGPVADIFKSLPPLLSTVQDQTGISPPAWLAGMPDGKDSSFSTTVTPSKIGTK